MEAGKRARSRTTAANVTLVKVRELWVGVFALKQMVWRDLEEP